MSRWGQVNGWTRLFDESKSGLPGLFPFYLTVRCDALAPVDFFTQNLSTGSAVVEPDSELYVVGGVVGISDPTVISEGLGVNVTARTVSPDTVPAYVLVQESNGGRTLTAGFCWVGSIFGSQRHPYYWPAPWILRPGSDVSITLDNRFPAAASFFFTLFGFKRYLQFPAIRPDVLAGPQLSRLLSSMNSAGPQVHPEPFFFPISFQGSRTVRAAFQTEQGSFTVTDVPFAVCHLMAGIANPEFGDMWTCGANLENNAHQYTGFAGGNDGSNGPSQSTVRLVTDNGQTRLDDRPVGMSALFGSARHPHVLPSPMLLGRGETMTALVNLTDPPSSPDPLRADLTFAGVRLLGA